MQEIVSIAPTVNEPGLVAYECRRCGHKTSVLQQADASCER
jgi:predicted nucleic acid-binding Zn ribbon protein